MENDLFLLIGSYTTEDTPGIYVYRFDENTGEAESVSDVDLPNSTYQFWNKKKNTIYSVAEETGHDQSYVAAYIFDKYTGVLRPLNEQLTQGKESCYLTMDPTEKYLVSANYDSGSITVFPIGDDGSLGPASQVIHFEGASVDPDRQTSSHVHCVEFSPDGKYLFVTDLGTDNIYRFNVNEESAGELLDAESQLCFEVYAGSGPRHIAFHPNGKYLYLVNELAANVMVFGYENGYLFKEQELPIHLHPTKGGADLVFSKDCRFLYVSNRLKNDGIAVYSISDVDGKLLKVDYTYTGKHPRNINITPNGKYLLSANRDSNSVEIYKIDATTGTLFKLENEIEESMPVCVQFV